MQKKFVRQALTALLCGGLFAWALPAAADTSSSTWQTRVGVGKQGNLCQDDPSCFNRLHPDIPPAIRANPGDMITFATRDAFDSGLTLDSTAADVTALDLNLVHPMTGPVHIEGAERGDAIAVTLHDIEPDEYGYTLIVPGFGFLRDVFTEPYIVNWKLSRTQAVSDQMPGVKVPFNGFMGSVGVLPGRIEMEQYLARETQLASFGGVALPPEPTGALPRNLCGPQGPGKDECLRTVPPREIGGNMDVKQMQVGTKLMLPCFVDGCGLFVGDVHYAQGDGEVSGTAIEMGARVRVSVEVIKGGGDRIRSPQFSGGNQLIKIAPPKFHATIGMPFKHPGEIPPHLQYLRSDKLEQLTNLSEDLSQAARNALLEMIDWIVMEKGMTKEQAYILASVAVDLRISQVVDVPNYVVTAILDTSVFDE